ncbi:MAG: hypothetical protein JJT95_11100 [Pararhodobacter sp.]|nr:hypothetical protein [Pararhodobacter sp.]
MLRFFDLFGQSAALNALDGALRAAGVHPLLVPDGVKLTLVRLHKQAAAEKGRDAAYGEAAQLFCYCMLGHEQFGTSNGADAAERAAQRLEGAINEGDSLDARIVLLALHAGLIAPEIADRIEVDEG